MQDFYRANVTRVVGKKIWVTIPRIGGSTFEFGPFQSLVIDLDPGTDVIVGRIDSTSDFIVFGGLGDYGRGNTITTGEGPPVEDGALEDLYLDTLTGDLYKWSD